MEPRSLNRHFDGIRTHAGYRTRAATRLPHRGELASPAEDTTARRPQRIARHADLEVILGIYAHTALDAMREALDSIEWDDL